MQQKDKLTDSYMNGLLDSLVKTYDIRACVFAAFFRVGFDLHELTPPEKQYMEMIRDPVIYQRFFASLSQAVFLEAHAI